MNFSVLHPFFVIHLLTYIIMPINCFLCAEALLFTLLYYTQSPIALQTLAIAYTRELCCVSSASRLMLDNVRVINFLLLLIIIINS